MTARPAGSPRPDAARAAGGEGAPGRRVFFALWPDAEAVEILSGWARQAHAAFGGRIMRPETLHLTLAFLGTVPLDRIADLTALLEEARPIGGTLRLDRYGRFHGPKIVWAGPSATPPWLDALHGWLWRALARRGFARPDEPFRPHVSLLRRAEPGELDTLPAPAPLDWTPRRCVLAASAPSPAGSFYEILAERVLTRRNPHGSGG
ncbi:2'-5' RNA ligase [Castellaniella defragrans 65Phen]|uniref:RNA 2',3'-cyclic phosphodiesterase n=1 Tax=Castellaniella defragrans (strain DSM 12143 / CCUG 39792 / 65Phen) TaxID=1437824 RepID=W8X8C3_CASD6|nr:RNA 2',3'-cyclic phosphodiesterase [Castellaniella defragrans]CDM22825.1 2'-5' RNA ligase [Castellaniella defragrans 65Phen]